MDQETPSRDACDIVRPLLPAAALEALDPVEWQAVDAHARMCSECRHLLRDYADVVDALGLLAPPRHPPLRLRDRILTARDRKMPVALSRGRRWAVAAAAILIVGLLGSNLILWAQLADARAEVAMIHERRQQAATRPLKWYDLTAASGSGPAARGTLCATQGGGVAWLLVEGLPPLPEARVYQLWLIEGDGSRASAGVFTVDGRGRGFLTVWLQQPIEAFESVGVTDEPAGGSPHPTGTRHLAGSV